MTTYQTQKNNAREKAIEWQSDFGNHNYSYGEIVDFWDYFLQPWKAVRFVGRI